MIKSLKSLLSLRCGFGNLKDVTSSFVLTANILMGILSKMEIEEVIVPSILITRWNAKEMAVDYRVQILGMDPEETEEFRIEHENIQSNLTEKWEEELNRHFSEEEMQMVNRHTNSCSALLISREM